MNIDNDMARHLECGSHRGEILRKLKHGALESRRKNTTVRARTPEKGDYLRWRRERPASNASIRRLRPSYVSGHKTADLRWGVRLGGGSISSFSRAQATTAEGTSEKEYAAMSEIMKEVKFLPSGKGLHHAGRLA